MNFVNKDYIAELMQGENLYLFTLCGVDGKSILCEQDDEATKVGEAIQKLDHCLESLEPNQVVYLTLRRTSKKDKGLGGSTRGNYQFKIRTGTAKAISGHTPQIDTSLVNSEILRLMQEKKELELKMAELKAEQKHAELERKIEEIKNESVLDKYAPQIMGVLQSMFAKQTSAPVAVAGLEQEETQTETTPKQRITAAINRLLKVDKNLVETLELLATFAEQQPQSYLGFLPMLKAQVK